MEKPLNHFAYSLLGSFAFPYPHSRATRTIKFLTEIDTNGYLTNLTRLNQWKRDTNSFLIPHIDGSCVLVYQYYLLYNL